MANHPSRARRHVTESGLNRALLLLSAPNLLSDDEKLAAENVLGGWGSHDTVAVRDIELVERTPFRGTLPTPKPQPAKTSWAAWKAEAARLEYPIPSGALSRGEMDKIKNDLRKLGARAA